MDPRPRERVALAFALVCSGAAALVYESTWGRMLHRVFGVSDWAVATVLAAFFLGMGIGAALGGVLARRAANPIRAYAGLEIFTALWAMLSLVLVPRIHHAYAALGPSASFATLTAARFGLALAILLPPTIAMGATLPVLVRRFESAAGWQSQATFLYAVNTLGAAVGAGATGFVLLPKLGARGSVFVAAWLSAFAALVALLSLRGADPDPSTRASRPSDARDEGDEGDEALSPGLVVVLAFASGLLALGGEVLFTRLLRIVIQGTSQAFAAMLVCYLVGITAGTIYARREGLRGMRALATFGRSQLAAAVLVSVGIASASTLPRLVGLLRGEAELVPHEVHVVLVVAALALLPLATAVGTGLPLVFAMTDSAGGSRTAGRVLAANTLGGLVGSLLAGFAAVPTLGLEVSLYALAVLHAVIALLAMLTSASDRLGSRLFALGSVIGLVATLLVARPSIHLPFLLDSWSDATRSIIEGAPGYDRSHVVFVREGRNTTVSVVDRENVLRLFNDGRPESGISGQAPYFGPELMVLGGMPALLAEHRERAMVIGLGAGHSTTSLLAGNFEHVDVVELEPAVVVAARQIHRMRNRPFPLDDRRRATLVVDDARARLALARASTYDAIVSQPSHPWLSGVSALYTQEFFDESKRALRPGGILALWVNVFRMDVAHLRAVTATVRSVFPHVIAFVVEDSSFILMASDKPFALGDRLGARLASAPKLRELLAGYEIDTTARLLATMELDDAGTEAFAREGSILIDDRPELEYALSALPHNRTLSGGDIDRALRAIPWISPATQASLPEHLRETLPLYRMSRLETRRAGLVRVGLAMHAMTFDPSHRSLAEGSLAEMLGDVGGALANYDASDDVEAATRADSLRLIDGSPWQALEAARDRAVVPHDATSLLRAAFITARHEDFELALDRAGRAEEHASAAYLRVAGAYFERGCLAALAVDADASELDPETLRFLAECARSIGDPVRARQLEDDRALSMRAVAQQWYDRGQAASTGGNVALAIHFFRRTLAQWPAHRDAAEELAEALCLLDRCADAAPVLESAIRALRFVPPQAETLRAVAHRLDVDVEP